MTANTMTKTGAALFMLWGILHVWVGYEGLHQYLQCVFRVMVGTDFTGSRAVISREAGH